MKMNTAKKSTAWWVRRLANRVDTINTSDTGYHVVCDTNSIIVTRLGIEVGYANTREQADYLLGGILNRIEGR